MATKYSTNASLINDGVTARNLGSRASGATTNQVLHVCIDTFTIPAGFASNDIVTLPRLPKGAVVIPALCAIHADKVPAATSIAFKIGLAADDDEYSAAVTVNAAGTFAFTGAADQSLGLSSTIQDGTSTTDLLATATVTGTIDTTATLTFRIVYAMRA